MVVVLVCDGGFGVWRCALVCGGVHWCMCVVMMKAYVAGVCVQKEPTKTTHTPCLYVHHTQRGSNGQPDLG